MAETSWSSQLKTKTAKVTHTFVIEDFLSKLQTPLPANVETYSSANFPTPDPTVSSGNLEFQINVTIRSATPSQTANEKTATVSVSLTQTPRGLIPAQQLQWQRNYVPVNDPLVPVRCKFWILGEGHKPIDECKILQGYYKGCGNPVDCSMGLDLKDILERPMSLLRLDHSLVVRCWIELNCGNEIVSGTTSPIDPDKLLHCRLYRTSFPDMYLFCDEIKLSCHKHMLAASSDVFKVMFSNDRHKESKSDEVHIQDVDPAALEKLLEYVYTDNIREMDGFEHQLIYAADKYHMVNLKTFASNSAVNTLTVDNVCDFLDLGELVQSEYLIQKCLEYIYDHAEDVIGSDGWKSLSQNSSKHLFELAVKFGKL